MTALTAIEVVEAFNAAINHQDLEGLSALMSNSYTFIDSAGTVERGKETGTASWSGFFRHFPDYRNVFESFAERDGLVVALGQSHCSYEELSGPAIWTAQVKDGQVAVWQMYEDSREQRSKLGLSR
jgi:hypothetical protein